MGQRSPGGAFHLLRSQLYGLKSYTGRCRVPLANGADTETEKKPAITDLLSLDERHLCSIGENPYGDYRRSAQGG
ncbi:hypothetical protein [Succinimonas amylolytica]|uniref:hypothetical protein n=1 Tax=Succinimonas amylolytica TaxID=83769 RepID=UPI00036402FE|nr:hypothetical protein [Succinimonas amylolytica]